MIHDIPILYAGAASSTSSMCYNRNSHDRGTKASPSAKPHDYERPPLHVMRVLPNQFGRSP